MIPALGLCGSLRTVVVVGALSVVAVVGAWKTRDGADGALSAAVIAQPASVPSVLEAEAQLAAALRRELSAHLRERRGVVTLVRREYGCTGSFDVERIELDGLRARRSVTSGPGRPLAIEPATWHRLADALTLSTQAFDDGDPYASTGFVIGAVTIPATSEAGAAIEAALAPLVAQMQADQQAEYSDTVVELTVHRRGERKHYRIDRTGVARRERAGWTSIDLVGGLAGADLIDAVLAQGVRRTRAYDPELFSEATVRRAGAVRRLLVVPHPDSPLSWL